MTKQKYHTEEERQQARREARDRYYVKNKERIDAEKKQYLLDHPERRKATTAKYRNSVRPKQLQERIDNYEEYLFRSCRRRAADKNLPFEIDITDIVIPSVCPYLGLKLTKEAGVGRRDNSPSVDKIDPSKGYIKGNVEVISDKANRMKNNATKEELIQFCNVVLKRFVNE